MKTQCTTKIGGKFSLDPSYFVFKKISFPVTYLMHYYTETGRSWIFFGIPQEGPLVTIPNMN